MMDKTTTPMKSHISGNKNQSLSAINCPLLVRFAAALEQNHLAEPVMRDNAERSVDTEQEFDRPALELHPLEV